MVVDRTEIVDDVRCGGTHASGIVKGKRTKRQRHLSPFESRISTSCSGGAGEGGDSATTSDESTMITSTEEEEDMARFLILLAQSGDDSSGGKDVLTPGTRSGFYVYECKTCNRVFPSFQALGGHRASHKKPKTLPPTAVEPPALLPSPLHLLCKTLMSGATRIAITNKQKVHECSICGSEFGSGQALGGHMRRHRTTVVSQSSDMSNAGNSPVSDEKLSRNVLPLDLNLPAPEDDLISRRSESQDPHWWTVTSEFLDTI